MGRNQAMSYKELGRDFQIKINDLIDENYALKNKVSNLEGKLENAEYQTKNLESTLSAFEERDNELGKGTLEKEL